MSEIQQDHLPKPARKLEFGITEGLAIASAPFVGYLLAFIYEAGYASHFGYEFSMIDIGLTTVLLALFAFAFGVFYVYLTIELFRFTLLRWVKDYEALVIFYLPFVVIILTGIVIGNLSFHSLLGILAIFIFLVISEFVGPMKHIPNTTYLERLRHSLKRRSDADESLLSRLFQRAGHVTVALISIGIAAVWLSYVSGKGQASRKVDFLVQASSPNKVLIRQYGDRYIFSVLRPDSNRLTDEFVVLTLDSRKELLLKRKRIGRLVPYELPNTAVHSKPFGDESPKKPRSTSNRGHE